MDKQKQAWNNFDINEFMKGYLNFENLVFLVKMDLYMDGIILKKDILEPTQVKMKWENCLLKLIIFL